MERRLSRAEMRRFYKPLRGLYKENGITPDNWNAVDICRLHVETLIEKNWGKGDSYLMQESDLAEIESYMDEDQADLLAKYKKLFMVMCEVIATVKANYRILLLAYQTLKDRMDYIRIMLESFNLAKDSNDSSLSRFMIDRMNYDVYPMLKGDANDSAVVDVWNEQIKQIMSCIYLFEGFDLLVDYVADEYGISGFKKHLRVSGSYMNEIDTLKSEYEEFLKYLDSLEDINTSGISDAMKLPDFGAAKIRPERKKWIWLHFANFEPFDSSTFNIGRDICDIGHRNSYF